MYPPIATDIPSTSNASLDKVVFQIERLSGQINIVSIRIDEAIQEMSARGQQTVSSLTNNFNKDTVEHVKRMLFLFFLAKGGEEIAQKKYRKRIRLSKHDIERL
uniref:V-SNARE coiled-coil homology domain-containing protein n=1 Tax=Heterorhabditis bacteriophora TaxID=37862 RepID=A0A1I7XFI0_HETBA